MKYIHKLLMGTFFIATIGLGQPTFTAHAISTSCDGAYSVYAADVDGDGDMDVLSASAEWNDVIAWYENDGSESFTKHGISTSDPYSAVSVYAADVDGDGDMDVLSAQYLNDIIAWYENDGSESFTEHVISTSANGAYSVYAADVDGDGDMDVLSASYVDNKIAWYENDGSESFTVHVISTTADDALSVYAADMDGDGDIDVLSASHEDDKIAWYENDGSESFTAHAISTSANGAYSVYAADVDGDGDMDVLSASRNDDKIAWYENNGSQGFTQHVISTSADWAKSVYAADMDSDGDLDVLSASRNDNKIAWYENDGSESFTEHAISYSANGASSVYAVDVDGDGDMDVLSASENDNKIAWYEHDGCPADDGTDGGELWGECYSIETTDSLDLNNSGLTGEISPEIDLLTNLAYLDLGNNELTGSIPPEIGNLTNLTYLNLGSNQLTGEIPSEIGNLTNLTELVLNDNQLTGSIPYEIENLTNLTKLYLQNNQLIGEIPESICDLNINWSNDNFFNISNNQLCPPYPSCIEDYMGNQDPFCWNCYADDETVGIELWGVCYSIENTTGLNFNLSGLTGEIPPDIKWLTNLYYLDLGQNNLTGEIPPEIGNLTNLIYLGLNDNQLMGSIPYEIGNLTNLNELRLGNNQLTGEIPPEIFNPNNYLNFFYLDLGDNQLTGEVPAEIWTFTSLDPWGLIINDNQLTGEIPESICDLYLYWSNNFNISNNQFCPPYPECLEDHVGEQDISECEPHQTVWHVATTGSDDMGDGSEQNPFATIQTGIDAAYSLGDTVLVAQGIYCDTVNFIGKNIVVGSHYIIDHNGTFIDSTRLGIGNPYYYYNENCGDSFGGVKFINGEDSSAVLTGFTITSSFGDSPLQCINSSPTLSHLSVRNNNISGNGGGAIYLVNSNSNLEYLHIGNNHKTSANIGGAGIFAENSSLTIYNSLIVNNSSSETDVYSTTITTGGIVAVNSTLVLNNNTFFGNSGGVVHGGAIHFDAGSNGTIINSIFLDNEGPEEITGSAAITFSNVQGGWEGEGNIDANPLFCNPDSGDYTLAENSPCVGTGENGVNMGAFGVGCGPYNFSPTNFSLSAPSNNAQITIDDSNMNDGFITFSWDESSDENGDSLVYLLHATSTEIEDFSLDTNTTSIDIPYMELVDEMSENNITSATIEWTVDVTDGIDTVTADNAPFTLNVDGSDALGALAEQLIPQVFALHQNYPNPFNPTTTLRYDLPEDALVNITIYDMMGRQIKTLVSGQQSPGYKSVQWNATNDAGASVSAGLYLYMIQAGEFRQTRKMVLIK